MLKQGVVLKQGNDEGLVAQCWCQFLLIVYLYFLCHLIFIFDAFGSFVMNCHLLLMICRADDCPRYSEEQKVVLLGRHTLSYFSIPTYFHYCRFQKLQWPDNSKLFPCPPSVSHGKLFLVHMNKVLNVWLGISCL